MENINNPLSLLPEFKQLSQLQGEKFLQFSLKKGINGLVSLAQLQGTIEIALTDILPVPQIAQYWLGITNWQGEAIWILDLAQLLGAPNWCQQESIATSGMVILTAIENRTVGLLVKEVQGIKTYNSQACLPVAEVNTSAKMKSLFKGYFLNSNNEPSMVLNLDHLFYLLQN